jgi:hypothetical protein
MGVAGLTDFLNAEFAKFTEKVGMFSEHTGLYHKYIANVK